MALQLPFKAFNFTFPEAYVKVMTGSWDDTNNTAQVAVYANAEARKVQADPIASCTINFKFDLNNTANIKAQAYAVLKARDEFKAGVDI